MQRTKLVVFDCDGTLVDSQHTIVAAMHDAFEAVGASPPSAGDIRGIIGLSLAPAIARLVGERDLDHAAIADRYATSYRSRRMAPDHHEPLYDGVRDTLDRLLDAGCTLGIATGKSYVGLCATLERHGLSNHFRTLQTADRAFSKPHPEMLLRAMEDADAEPASTWMVGDTIYDIEMARAAGVRPVAVGWGYHSPGDLQAAGAETVLAHCCELLAWMGLR